ncbi:MAG: 5 10-methylenetetrahydrofolate reductase-like protein [Thaumarchaeota archaeon CSP1-1]|nr:MAG: 5 10-methylenetetrahydrofolate reductase-like protein [Thaumarchaeota archaeon CSP1-1]
MTLRYEINPPKITQNSNLSQEDTLKLLDKVKLRVSEISTRCDGIHFTDSVLGIPRISPITTGTLIRKSNQKIEITVSLRVRDKNLTTLRQLMEDAVSGGLNGVLILKGDPSPNEQKDSGLIPSSTVKYFKELGFDKKIDIFLSLPSNPSFDKIQKKIDAEPTGFITQVIHSADEVSRIVDKLKPSGFKIIPCVLLPSEKNAKSAKFLKLDWSEYKNSVEDFIKQVHQIAGEVLITSPNDFNYAKEILGKL